MTAGSSQLTVGSQVGQQRSLNKRQLFQGDVLACSAQQWLDKREIRQRCREINVAARELEHERVGESHQEFTRRGKSPPCLKRRVRCKRSAHRQPVVLDSIAVERRVDDESLQEWIEAQSRWNQRSVVGISSVITAEELSIQSEPFRRDIQCGQIECLQLALVGRRVDVSKSQRGVDVEFDRAILADFDIFGERLLPPGIL